MAGTPINNNNLPQGVTVDPNSGLYIITNDKGQTSRVGAGTQEELNSYANSWKTGTPVTVTTTSPLDGSPSQQVFDPAAIQAQNQAAADYSLNRANLRAAGIGQRSDGTYFERGSLNTVSNDEVQRRLAANGAAPSTTTPPTNPSPTTAEVAASTNSVNTVTNTPSNLQPAPSDNSLNSPLTVDGAGGATIVNASQNPTVAPTVAQTNASILSTIAPGSDPAVATPTDPNYIENFSPAPADEFAGINAQVADNIENPAPTTVSDPAVIDQQIQAVRDENIQNYQAANIDPAANVTAAVEAENAANAAALSGIGGTPNNAFQGTSIAQLDTQSKATQQDVSNFQAKADWRVRLSLSPGAKSAGYLYWANPAGILAPLQATDGVIFPYTPAISVQYNATYDPTELTHSNYKYFTYRGSAVDSVTIGCDFTAQDTFEAEYLLAVIHFFRSITKMFYGLDQNPKNGTPPPLCYLSGLGAFQFDAHPLAIQSFTYSLPTDVDYIIAGSTSTPAGVNRQNNPSQGKPGESMMAQAAATRLGPVLPGALVAPPNFQTTNTGTKDATYVPTKISLSITAVPIVTRNDISNNFSLKKYATGELLRGTQRSGGGIW